MAPKVNVITRFWNRETSIGDIEDIEDAGFEGSAPGSTLLWVMVTMIMMGR